jgi:hypothetical protein
VVVSADNHPLVDTTEAQVDRRDRARLDVINALNVQIESMDMRLAGLEGLVEHQAEQLAQRDLENSILVDRVQAADRQSELWERRYRSERNQKLLTNGALLIGALLFVIL